MDCETPAAAKPNRAKKSPGHKKYLKIPYTYVRLIVSVLLAFCLILCVSFFRIQQFHVTEEANVSEYMDLLNKYNDLQTQANELTAKLNSVENKNDSTQDTLNQQAQKLNEQDSEFTQNLDEFQKKAEELQNKLDELEKQKEDIVNQLNGIPYLPGITSQSLTQPIPLAISYSSDPIQLLGYKLDSLNDNADQELSSFQDLMDTFNTDKPILNDYPTIWPVKGKVTSGYGTRQNPMGGGTSEFHSGMDIAVPMYTDVKATGGGVVKEAGWNSGGYGNLVVIDNGNGIETYYGHNSEVLVKKGEKVTRGQIIAKSGSTGNSTGPHVHYEVRVNGSAVNPQKYLLINN